MRYGSMRSLSASVSASLRALALLVLVAAAGCTHVKPYEREYLSHPGMDRKREALTEEFEGHVHDSREGAIGSGANSTGGGCGCN